MVNILGRQAARAHMVSVFVVVICEAADRAFKITGQEVVFLQTAVLHALVPTVDLSVDLGMLRRAVHAPILRAAR